MVRLSFIAIFIFYSLHAYSQFAIDGIYHGKSLYFTYQKHSRPSQFEVWINNAPRYELVDSTGAFELDLSQKKIMIGDSVRLNIAYTGWDNLQLLNPEVLTNSNAFKDSVMLTNCGIWWMCTDPQKIKCFVVKRLVPLLWAKDASKVEGNKIMPDPNRSIYYFPMHLFNEENVIEVNYEMKTGEVFSRQMKCYIPDTDSAKYYFSVKNNEIHFKRSCKYEVYDKFGNIKLKGEGEKIKFEGFEPDVYYLSYLNYSTEFIISKKGKVKHY